ncbi:hypothetical protein [Corallococcus carmarthensis]|nr:hypothetical protein [Corallococcus carmarthensis]
MLREAPLPEQEPSPMAIKLAVAALVLLVALGAFIAMPASAL